MTLLDKIRGINLPTKVTIIIGALIISVGIYFSIVDLRTSGVTMGEAGEPYGSGTIDGKGIVFCGIILIAIGLITFNTKMHKDQD